MRLPEINNSRLTDSTIGEFTGLQKNKPKITEKNFESCINMAHDYPAAKSRERRKVVGKINNIYGFYTTADGIYYVAKDNNDAVHLYYNGSIVTKSVTSVSNGETVTTEQEVVTGLTVGSKQMVMMGAYLIIWPEKIMLNTNDLSCKNLEFKDTYHPYSQSTSGFTYGLYMSDKDGSLYRYSSATAEDATTGNNLNLYGDIDYTYSKAVAQAFAEKGLYKMALVEKINDQYYVKYYVPTTKSWRTEDVFCTISIYYSGANFKDDVEALQNCDYVLIGAVAQQGTTHGSDIADLLNGSKKLIIARSVKSNTELRLVLGGIDCWKYTLPDSEISQNHGQITTRINDLYELGISNYIPTMNYITSAGNRLWGCSSSRHEIYASKLGDPGSFRAYTGIASDSYAVTIGSSGNFTGACVYNDYPVFFKEDRIITLYGTRPRNYQINEIICDGLKAGCQESIALMDERLYYLSKRGVMRYDGNYPACISQNLGDIKYKSGKAAGVNGIYYLAVKDNLNTYHLMKYEVATGIWLEDDNQMIDAVFAIKNNVYAVIDDELLFMTGLGEPGLFDDFNVVDDVEVEWEFVTGDLVQGITDKAVIGRMYITFELDAGAEMEALIQYDRDRSWNRFAHKKSEERKTFNIRLMPRRCEKIKLKFRGKGQFRLYQITRKIKKAGDM